MQKLQKIIDYILKRPTLVLQESKPSRRAAQPCVSNINDADRIIFDSDSFTELYWAMQMLQIDNHTMFCVLNKLKANPRFCTMISVDLVYDFLKGLMIDWRTRSYIDNKVYILPAKAVGTDSYADIEQIMFMIQYLLDRIDFKDFYYHTRHGSYTRIDALISDLCAAACCAEYRFSLEEIKMFIRAINECSGCKPLFKQLYRCFSKCKIDIAEVMVDFFIAEGADTVKHRAYRIVLETILDHGWIPRGTEDLATASPKVPFHDELVRMFRRKNLVPTRREILSILFRFCLEHSLKHTSSDAIVDLRNKFVATIRLMTDGFEEFRYHFTTYMTVLRRIRIFASEINTKIYTVLYDIGFSQMMEYVIGDLSPDYHDSTEPKGLRGYCDSNTAGPGIRRYGIVYDPLINDFLDKLEDYLESCSEPEENNVDLLTKVLCGIC